MKKTLMTFLSIMLIAAMAFGTGKKEKQEGNGESIQKGLPTVQAPSSSWLPVNGPSMNAQLLSLKSVEFSPKNSNVLWLGGYSNAGLKPDVVLRTTDGGASWSQNTLPTSNLGATNIAVKNDTVAITGTYNGFVLRTVNGGVKWDTVYSYSTVDTAFMDGITYVGVTRDTAIVIGDADGLGCLIARSTNGGLTWTRNLSLPTAAKEAYGYASYATYGQAVSVYGNTIWTTWYYGSTRDPLIIKSTDAGVTWTSFTCALPGGMANNYYFRSINMATDSIGFAVGRRVGGTTTDFDNWVMKTTNGGTSWDTLSVQSGAHNIQKAYSAKPIPGTTNVVAVGFSTLTGAKSWWSTDNGATWTTLATPGTSNLTNSAFANATTGFAVGYLQTLKYANSVAVTFNANTATIPDTLKSTSFVNLRGGGSALTWGNDAPKMTNVGGDYWKTTIRVAPGSQFEYKFFANAAAAPPATGDFFGWDGDPNRPITVGQSDTTLPLQYAYGTAQGTQYWKPWGADSAGKTEVWFRVNMKNNQEFNPATMKMGVRGGTAPLDWGVSIYLKQEPQHVNAQSRMYDGSNFWSGVVRFPTPTTATPVDYKFVIEDAIGTVTWEDNIVGVSGNRQFTISANLPDTTLYWKHWRNVSVTPPAGTDTLIVTYTTNLASAIANNRYHSSTFRVCKQRCGSYD
jgi:hypothetical protein